MSERFPNFGDERLPARFWNKCVPEPNSGCWLAIGSHTHDGYGRYSVRGSLRLMHRVAYEALVETTPHGLVLDHKCRTRCCCNPAHLEPVTIKVNQERGIFFNSLKTSCPKGHPYSEENTQITIRKTNQRPKRKCKQCIRAYHKQRTTNQGTNQC